MRRAIQLKNHFSNLILELSLYIKVSLYLLIDGSESEASFQAESLKSGSTARKCFWVSRDNFRLKLSMCCTNFQFSKHRPSGPMLSISQNVCLSVCLSVCVCVCVCSLLRYRLTVFLPPLPKVGCPKFRTKRLCPYVCVCVCVFTFEVPFNGLLAPTS